MGKLSSKSLMIGDWVYCPIINKQEPIQIKYGYQIEECEDLGYVPIPISCEILEKNGWESLRDGSGDFVLTAIENGQKYYDYDATVTFNNLHFVMNRKFYKGLPIIYVHELQHALRLCGIEKEIVL